MSTLARRTIEEYDRMIAAGIFDGPQPRRIELIQGELREILTFPKILFSAALLFRA
jgi:hypothetical protein